VTVQPAKKFYVFHQRHFWKSANVQEGSSPAEQPVIAASHSEQNACVMRKSVGQAINEASRQANPEVTADDSWVVYDACNLIQTSLRNFGIDMEEPKHIALRSTRARIHLHRPIALAFNKLIAKACGEFDGPSELPPSATIISAPGARSRRCARNGRISSASLNTGTMIENFGRQASRLSWQTGLRPLEGSRDRILAETAPDSTGQFSSTSVFGKEFCSEQE